MTPADIGLPVKFRHFRPNQEDIAVSAAISDRRFTLLSAPTGSGKSLIYMSIAQLLDARTLVLTATKGLQHQASADYAEIGLTDIRGQNNYRCIAVDEGAPLSFYDKPGTPCSDGPCRSGIFCTLKPTLADPDIAGCTYYDAVARARGASLVIGNYAHWMTLNRYSDPGTLGKFDLLILDEAHQAPDLLADFCSIRVEASEVKALLDIQLPPIDWDTDAWMSWAARALVVARERYTAAREELASIFNNQIGRRRTGELLRRLTALGRNLKALAVAHSWRRSESGRPDVWLPGAATDWVIEKTADGVQFSPVWAHAYAEEYLFRQIPRVILTSAVLLRKTGHYLGIPDEQSEFREFASTFDPERRLLIYIPTTTVDRHMTEGQVRQWINRIDAIIGTRLDRNGIIHTRSYDRARLILERSRYRHLMVTHHSRNTRDVVEQFKRAKAPCILVSPSLEEGYDFVDDTCRYQIIAKVPFIDTRSPVIKARAKSDRNYVNHLTVMSVIQQVGRGTRSHTDWCETFIIDDHWAWWSRAVRKLFPAWFIKAWRVLDRVPEPPPLRTGPAARPAHLTGMSGHGILTRSPHREGEGGVMVR